MKYHYRLEVPVGREEVEIIKSQFSEFINESGGFAIYVKTENDVAPSEELEKTIQRIFLNILIAIDNGKFEGIH